MEEKLYKILPINLEFENMYGRFIIFTKKRYIATIINDKGQIINKQRKGVITARKDNSRIARKICGEIMEMVLNDDDRETIYNRTIDLCTGFFTRQISVKDLIIYKGIQAIDSYKQQNAAHVALARRMRDRGDEVPPNTRMEYVMLWNGIKDQLQGDKAEDYNFYRENRLNLNLQLDYVCYISNQIAKPLQQVLDTVFPGEQRPYTDHEIYIFGNIYKFPKAIYSLVLDKKIVGFEIKIERLLEMCQAKIGVLKDDKKYIVMVTLCQKYLTLFDESKEGEKNEETDTRMTEIKNHIFGHIRLMPFRNSIYKAKPPGTDLYPLVNALICQEIENAKNISERLMGEFQDIMWHAKLMSANWKIAQRCKYRQITPPRPHKPFKKSFIAADGLFMEQLYTAHFRHRNVVETIKYITKPFIPD